MKLAKVKPVAVALLLFACNNQPETNDKKDISAVRQQEKDDMIIRGQYLVTIGGCADCHSPKKFTQLGPVEDSTRTLSGHPANAQLPPTLPASHKPGAWAQMAQDGTAFAGPWGISYTANLTPDSATGIGAWSEEVFIKTLRTGRHLGHPDGRPILPPMPWPLIGKMTDDDLKAVYAYLRSLPPIKNKVPEPKTPAELNGIVATSAKK